MPDPNRATAVNATAKPIDLKRALEAGTGPFDIVVVYDGQCVFCSSYVKLMRLRASAGRVLLLDARQGNSAAQVKVILDLDLDEGMLVLYGELAFWGADAMHILGTLTSTSDVWNAATAFVFRRPWLARLLYPPLKIGRSLALFLLGRPRIR
jgi:predicted DCC family thiol-disulfide oxidoreductase YuxK